MNRVAQAEDRVAFLETLSGAEWSRLERHRLSRDFFREWLRSKCLTDFWAHMNFACYWGQMHHYDPVFHGPAGMAGFLTRWRRSDDSPIAAKGNFVSRSLCKTQETMAWVSWELAREPNHRVLVRSFSDELAGTIGSVLQAILESPVYQRMYPWVRAAKKDNGQRICWRKNELLIERSATGLRTSSMLAAGIDASVTGEHFTIGIYDDWETEKNAYEDTQRRKMVSKFMDDKPLFEAGSRRIINGTPWHPDGLVQKCISQEKPCNEWGLDLNVHAATVAVHPHEFCGDGPTVSADGLSFDDPTATFPTGASGDLVYCQATVRYWDPTTGDTVEAIREVRGNSATRIEVNRPLPRDLGAADSYVVGNKKPVCPIRMTLDDVDWTPPDSESDRVCARISLPQVQREMGSTKFAAQYDMDAVDRGNLLLDKEYLQRVSWEDFRALEGEVRVFRAGDFASGGDTEASSAITTGALHASGYYILHMYYEPRADLLEKVLELFVGIRRVERWGYHLRSTLLEPAQIEKSTLELVNKCSQDPYAFFDVFDDPKYKAAAREWFVPGEPVPLLQRQMSRTKAKTYRILGFQAPLEASKVYVVENCPHFNTLCDHLDRFKIDSKQYLDLLETVADIEQECRLPIVHARPPSKGKQFRKLLRETAGLQGLMRGHRVPVSSGRGRVV